MYAKKTFKICTRRLPPHFSHLNISHVEVKFKIQNLISESLLYFFTKVESVKCNLLDLNVERQVCVPALPVLQSKDNLDILELNSIFSLWIRNNTLRSGLCFDNWAN